jgi:hypothetical protein
MEQLVSHGKNFLEISYFRIFRKSFDKVQIWINSGKNRAWGGVVVKALRY